MFYSNSTVDFKTTGFNLNNETATAHCHLPMLYPCMRVHPRMLACLFERAAFACPCICACVRLRVRSCACTCTCTHARARAHTWCVRSSVCGVRSCFSACFHTTLSLVSSPCVAARAFRSSVCMLAWMQETYTMETLPGRFPCSAMDHAIGPWIRAMHMRWGDSRAACWSIACCMLSSQGNLMSSHQGTVC